MPTYMTDGLKLRNLVTAALVAGFMPGVTVPFYEETLTLDGAKNVGLNPAVPLTPWTGAVTNGLAQVTAAGLYENIHFQSFVEVRAEATFRNCRFDLPYAITRTDIVKSIVQILNGANSTGIVFENCEIHNLAQRPMNGIMGRNFVMRRSVVTGCIDPWSDSAAGGAPNTGYAFTIEDCIAPTVAWWFSPTSNPDIHNPDTGSHSDVIQKATTLQCRVFNSVLGAYVSERIGTGTPGSGADAGNPYRPPSGYAYITDQAQMNAWRAQHTLMTTPSQTMGGVARRLASNGSLAGVMLNDGYIEVDQCYIGGGTVGINAADASVPYGTVKIDRTTFWNDMLNGPGARSSDPTVKGYAVLAQAGATFGSFTGNRSFDGAPLVAADSGGFRTWR